MTRPPARHRIPQEAAFPAAFAQAIQAKGVSLDWLRSRLRERGAEVSLATLSYWRSGDRQPERSRSLDAVSELEDLLGLHPGELTHRIGPARRRGPIPQARPIEDAMPERGELFGKTMGRLGYGAGVDVVPVALHISLDLDEHGSQIRQINRTVWRATADNVRGTPSVLVFDEGESQPPAIEWLIGGRTGRRYTAPEEGIFAHEILFERPLNRGEETITEQAIRYPRGVEERETQRYLDRRIPEVLLWVRFHPARLPSSAELYWVTDDDEGKSPLDVTDLTSIHHRVRRVGPGLVGIRWEW